VADIIGDGCVWNGVIVPILTDQSAGSLCSLCSLHRQSARMLTLPGVVACKPPVMIPGARWRSAGLQPTIPVEIPASA
jgi:hypothetical protein